MLTIQTRIGFERLSTFVSARVCPRVRCSPRRGYDGICWAVRDRALPAEHRSRGGAIGATWSVRARDRSKTPLLLARGFEPRSSAFGLEG